MVVVIVLEVKLFVFVGEGCCKFDMVVIFFLDDVFFKVCVMFVEVFVDD